MNIKNKCKNIIIASTIMIASSMINAPIINANANTIDNNKTYIQTDERQQTQTTRQQNIDNIILVAKQQMGKPYKWGATGPNSFDCSGFTSYAYKKGGNTSIPRTSRTQATAGKKVERRSLQKGDLVFFNTSGSGISHVGIYIGDTQFIHASSGGGRVKIDSLNSSYYNKRYVTGRRIVPDSEIAQDQDDLKGHWAESTINDFMAKKYVSGYADGTFRPNNFITRAEFVVILNNYFGLNETSGKVFNDTQDHWAKVSIDIAVTNGVCSGVTSTEFKPNAPITREEVAVMVSNYKKIYDNNLDKLDGYEDAHKVSNWAKESVEGIIEKSYMSGYSDNTFRPDNNITRAEAVVTLSRIAK